MSEPVELPASHDWVPESYRKSRRPPRQVPGTEHQLDVAVMNAHCWICDKPLRGHHTVMDGPEGIVALCRDGQIARLVSDAAIKPVPYCGPDCPCRKPVLGPFVYGAAAPHQTEEHA